MYSDHLDSEDALEVFFSYAHEDEGLRDELAKHLALLKRQGKIRSWCDRRILPGDEWERRIDERLETADVVLFLVSPDFLASNYCWDVEMTRALARHDEGSVRVIPVLIRPVDWRGTPFDNLQPLPTGAKPVTTWPDRDEAWFDVVQGIRAVIEEEIPRRRETAADCRQRLEKLYDSVDDLRHLLAARTVRQGVVAELKQRMKEDRPTVPGLGKPEMRSRTGIVNHVLRLLSRVDLPGVALLAPLGFGGREVVSEVMARLVDRPDDAGRRALPVRLVPDRRTLNERRLYRALTRNLRRELEHRLGRPLPKTWVAALPADEGPDRFGFEEALEDLLQGPVADEERSLVLAIEGLSRVGREDLLTWATIISRLTVDQPLKVLAWGGEELSDLCTGYAHLEHGSPFERLETVQLKPLSNAEVQAIATRGDIQSSNGPSALLQRASGGHPALLEELLRRREADRRSGETGTLTAWVQASPLLRRLRRDVASDADAAAALQRFADGDMTRRGTAGEERLRWLGIIQAADDDPRRWRWVAPVFEEWASSRGPED